MKSLKEMREALSAKRKELKEVFKVSETTDNGETVYDFQKADAAWLGAETLKLEGTAKSMRVCELVNERTAELNTLQDELTAREKAEQSAADLKRRENTPVNRPGNPESKNEAPKSFGQMVTEHKTYKEWLKGDKSGSIELDIGLRDLKSAQYKADFLTTAGWPPESIRNGVVVDAVTRPLQVIDIMPMGNTGMALVVYMQETVRTHAAAETAEAGTYPESTFELAEANSPVRKIADSVPVSDEQLEDVGMVESYLEGRLNFGVQQRLDQQIISGDGIAPNLTGILNTVGIQTRAKGVDPVPDVIFKMMVDIQTAGRAQPTHTLLNPVDWQGIRLLRTADGIYIWGSPAEQGTPRIWGLPVVSNEVLTAGTGLVGSFQPAWITLVERRGIILERGFVANQFVEGMQTIRASGRWAVVMYRPAAFGTVTGL